MELSYSKLLFSTSRQLFSVVRMNATYSRTIAIGLKNIVTELLMEDCRLRGKRMGKKNGES